MRTAIFASLACTVMGFATLAPGVAFGQVFVERVSPPSLVRGQVTRVTLLGSRMQQATGLWTSLPGGVVRATLVGPSEADKAVFDVETSPGAELGFYGLRLATDSGLSNAHLFLVDELVTTPEMEISRRPDGALQSVSLPAAVAGVCEPADVDRFAIDVSAGQSVTFELIASRLGKGFDPLVIIRDGRGRLLSERDNDQGLFFDCRFEHTFAKAGRCTVEVRDSRFGGSPHWGYLLRMGSFPVARVALPSAVRPGELASLRFPQIGEQQFAFNVPGDAPSRLLSFTLRRDQDDAATWVPLLVSDLEGTLEREPNNDLKQATPAAVPGMLHGNLAADEDRDWFTFDLKKGQRLRFRSETRVFGSPADLELVLSDPSGKDVQRVDNGGFENVNFNFTAKEDGRHSMRVQTFISRGGPEFVYRIEVRGHEPRIELTSGVARLAIPQGSRQPLPLTLTRTDFSGPVELSLIGAPEGLTLKSELIPAGSDTSGNVIFADRSTPPGVYTVQVVGRGQGPDAELTAVARTQPLVDRLPTGKGPHGEPFELRADQRRLPPTLTDQIAILITPPSPFDFEVPPVVALPRYLECDYHVQTMREAGFDVPIGFVARGGTLEPGGLGQQMVFASIPTAAAEDAAVAGHLRSAVQSTVTKHPVTVTGTAEIGGRRISLTRTFELDLRVAYDPAAEPSRVELKPGESARVKVLANRLKPYFNPITITPSRVAGLLLPDSITIDEGQPSAELEIKVSPDIKPGKYVISLPGESRVDRFQERAEGQKLEVVVVAAE